MVHAGRRAIAIASGDIENEKVVCMIDTFLKIRKRMSALLHTG
jgi:hypothetical protein